MSRRNESAHSVFLIWEHILPRNKAYLTQEGVKQLEAELGNLKSARRPEVAARIHKASETGGTVDNAEYDEAKNEQAFTEGRIRDLEHILANALVAPKASKSKETVEFGSSVTVVTDKREKRNYKVVGSAEAAPLLGKISNESPVGQALLGRKVGDEVEIETPKGVTKLTVTAIK